MLKRVLKHVFFGHPLKYPKSTHISVTARIHCEQFIIGRHCHLGRHNLIISAHGRVIIGNKVMFGPNVSIHGGNHNFNELGVAMIDSGKTVRDKDVIIGNDVWVGANVLILPGVTVGEGSIIGAGTILTKSVPENTICYSGTKLVMRQRFSDTDWLKHKRAMT